MTNLGETKMEITLEQLAELIGNKTKKTISMPFTVGENYFIRSVTHYYTGKLKAIKGQWLILEQASWIADTGRFHDFLKDGKCNEYESFIDDVHIPVGSIIDVTKWTHKLFTGQK